MKEALTIAQIVVSLALIGLILIQARGTGFGRGAGASGSSFSRRGLEKLVFRLSFLFSGLFLLISIFQLII